MNNSVSSRAIKVITIAVMLSLPLIQTEEGIAPTHDTSYADIGGVPSFCYGDTDKKTASWHPSIAECKDLLSSKAKKLANEIEPLLPTDNDPHFLAALISFSYNVGYGAFLKSTLLRYARKGQYAQACQQLFKWVYVKGVYVSGLYNRRVREYGMCMQGVKS